VRRLAAEVFPASQASQIVRTAHAINPRMQIGTCFPKHPNRLPLAAEATEPEHGVQAIRVLVARLIPQFDFIPAQDAGAR